MKVHTELGPGLLESSYHTCLLHELKKINLTVESEKSVPVLYDGLSLSAGYKVDIMVENSIILELKSVSKLTDLHLAQLLTYLKLSNKKNGLLINFNTVHLKDGIKRVINNKYKI